MVTEEITKEEIEAGVDMAKEQVDVPQMEVQLVFTMGMSEANQILAALGAQSYNTAAPLIHKMIEQARAQLPDQSVEKEK